MNKQLYLPTSGTPLLLSEPQINVPGWMIDLLDKAHDHAFETMIEQMQNNPDAIEALYGD